MCTLSWQLHNDHLSLVFNRDELLSRQKALPPEVHTQNGIRFLAPVDSKAGGTWLSGNEYGLVIALLNNYKVPKSDSKGRTFKSRGLLVRKLATTSSIFDIALAFQNEDLSQYSPFDLYAFSGIRQPHQWSWDGNKLIEIIAPSNPAVSSSLHYPIVKKWRILLFRKLRKKPLIPISEEKQLHFHHQRSRLFPAYSVAMKRSDRGTVSITHVTVGTDYIRMKYKDGDILATDNTFQNSFLPVNPQNFINRQLNREKPFTDIDINSVLKMKNEALHDSLPRWVFPIIHKVAMEKSINKLLTEIATLDGKQFAQVALNYLNVSGRLHTQFSALPNAESRPLFVANHPTGGLDGLLMLSLMLQYYPSSKMIVNDVLEHITQLQSVIVPVDLYQHSRKSAEILHNAFAGDDALLVFPAGRTGRIHKGLVRDFEWNKMPVRLAQKYNRTIVPVYIHGSNSWRFNLIASLRSRLGISLNLEMMLLVREFMKPANKTFDLYLGEPIPPEHVEKLAQHDSGRTEKLQDINEQIKHLYSSDMLL